MTDPVGTAQPLTDPATRLRLFIEALHIPEEIALQALADVAALATPPQPTAEALDVERLANAIRNALWPNWADEPDHPGMFWHADAEKVAAEYGAATPPQPTVEALAALERKYRWYDERTDRFVIAWNDVRAVLDRLAHP